MFCLEMCPLSHYNWTPVIAFIQGAECACRAGMPPPASAAPSAGAVGALSPPPHPAGSQPGPLAGPSTRPAPLPVNMNKLYYPLCT